MSTRVQKSETKTSSVDVRLSKDQPSLEPDIQFGNYLTGIRARVVSGDQSRNPGSYC